MRLISSLAALMSCVAVIVLLSATPTAAQTPTPPQNCINDLSGVICRIGPAAAALTNADYGTIYVQITPPNSVAEQAVKANKGGWKRWLKRYFLPSAKSGSLVAEVYIGPTKAAVIPIVLFSIDEKGGLKVQTQTTFSSSAQATPYFVLDAVSNPVKVVFTFQSSNTQSSNILSTFTSALGIAKQVGAQGLLLDAGAAPLTQSLGSIEQSIASNFNKINNSQSTVGATFEADSAIDYSFGFDPNGSDRTGRVTLQFVRRASLFSSNQATPTKLPVFPWGARNDPAAAAFVLDSKPTGDKLATYLDGKMLGQFSVVRSSDVNPTNFDIACKQTQTAIETLTLSPHDRVAALWAVLISGANVQRPEIRQTNCFTQWSQSFAVYGLTLPSTPAPTPTVTSPAATPPTPTPKKDPEPSANLSETGLRVFMGGVFQTLARSGTDDVRILALRSTLADMPHPAIDINPDFGLAALDDTANAEFVAEKLATLQYRAGCYFRNDDKSISYLARVLTPGPPDRQSLWVVNVHLTSSQTPPSASTTRVDRLTIRDAKAEDLTAFATHLPTRPGCANPLTAPE